MSIGARSLQGLVKPRSPHLGTEGSRGPGVTRPAPSSLLGVRQPLPRAGPRASGQMWSEGPTPVSQVCISERCFLECKHLQVIASQAASRSVWKEKVKGLRRDSSQAGRSEHPQLPLGPGLMARSWRRARRDRGYTGCLTSVRAGVTVSISKPRRPAQPGAGTAGDKAGGRWAGLAGGGVTGWHVSQTIPGWWQDSCQAWHSPPWQGPRVPEGWTSLGARQVSGCGRQGGSPSSGRSCPSQAPLDHSKASLSLPVTLRSDTSLQMFADVERPCLPL